MNKSIFIVLLLFVFSCTKKEPQDNVSRIPAPGQTEKRQVYIFLKEKHQDCFSDFWPEPEVFSRLNSRWSVSLEYIKDAEALKMALLDKNARNPELLIVGPGIKKLTLKLPHNGKSQVVWMEDEGSLNTLLSFAWKDLESLNTALCAALPPSKKCFKDFSGCPEAHRAETHEDVAELLLSGRFSSTPFVRVVVDWPKIFDELFQMHGDPPVVVGVSNNLMQLKIVRKDHPDSEALERAFKLWTLKKLGGGN